MLAIRDVAREVSGEEPFLVEEAPDNDENHAEADDDEHVSEHDDRGRLEQAACATVERRHDEHSRELRQPDPCPRPQRRRGV